MSGGRFRRRLSSEPSILADLLTVLGAVYQDTRGLAGDGTIDCPTCGKPLTYVTTCGGDVLEVTCVTSDCVQFKGSRRSL